MASIAASQYGGHFAGGKFVAFASPNIIDANGILNVGFENDPVYKLINNYGNFASSLDHIVLATPEYMAGNYDGRHPNDVYAHNAGALTQLTDALAHSNFINLMTPDSVVILDSVDNGAVQDITPGRESAGVFYLGQSLDDQISGREGNDYFEGFAGNDTLRGAGGNDTFDGGAGFDYIDGGSGEDVASGGDGNDSILGQTGADTLLGDVGGDFLFGGDGNDYLNGGADGDYMQGDAGMTRWMAATPRTTWTEA